MNRTKIEWTDYTWNPVSGCDHGCWYCYAAKICKRFPKNFPNGFKPTFWPERLMEPWKLNKPSKIFACSISDLFAPWTLLQWRNLILSTICDCPIKHTFQLLTKNPELIPDIPWPYNVWVGTTVTNENGDSRNIEAIKKVYAKIRFVSFEPLLGPLGMDEDLKGIEWIIIGKLTGSKKVELNVNWIMAILEQCEDYNIPVFLKNNLKLNNPRQEFPK